MKIEKIENLGEELRIKVGDGEADGEPFVISVLATGEKMGVLVEFDDEAYLAPTEEIVKEIVRFRGK